MRGESSPPGYAAKALDVARDMDLIITEKPSVARDIAKVLGIRGRGQGCIRDTSACITWCVGHMVCLADPEQYDPGWKRWRPETLPMLPERFKLKPIPSSADQFKVVKALIRDAAFTRVINACDAGREGELIFRYVWELAGGKLPVERLWLSSLTDQAVKLAFAHLKPASQYDNLGAAARCRSEADWLVGLNATRATTLRYRQAGGDELMSVGRVQTPTLALIVAREQEIEAFVSEPFWQVYATFDAGEQPEGIERTYEGLWTKKKVDRLGSEPEARAVLEAIDGGVGQVVKTQHKEVKEWPPQLFDLTGLQREANRRFGFSAQHTLDLAQALYEKHKVLTYPRTDSNFLTTDMKGSLGRVVKAVEVGPYVPFCQTLGAKGSLPMSKRMINDAEVGDHHAIIPTEKTPNLGDFSRDEGLIYDMVVRRFLAGFYPPAIFATTKIATSVAGHLFVTSGKVRQSAGWQEVEPPVKYKPKPGEKGKKEEPILPSVHKGDQVPLHDSRLHEGKTQPPKRFSENALLGAMERAGAKLDDATLRRAMKETGLGTPATRANMIETLIKRTYIARQGKTLLPTPKGRALIQAIEADALKSAELTGQWESKLGQVASGKLQEDAFMAEVRAMTRDLTGTILSQELTLSPEAKAQALKTKGEPLGTCPLCQGPVFETPKAYGCTTGLSCNAVIFKSVAGKKISPALAKLLLAGKTSQVLKGFKSKQKKPFEAALRLGKTGRVEFVFDHSPPHKDPGPPAPPKSATSPSPLPPGVAPGPEPQEELVPPQCPQCQQAPVIRGNRGWGCARWRQGCRWSVAASQFGHDLTQPQAFTLFATGHVTRPTGDTLQMAQTEQGWHVVQVGAKG